METQKYTRCINSEQVNKKWRQLQTKKIEPNQWDSIDWYKVNRSVEHLRSRIFVVTQRARTEQGSNLLTLKKLRKLQENALFSYDTLLLAVRRVIQNNKGKNSSNTEVFFIKTKQDRFRLVILLRFYVDVLNWSPKSVQTITRKAKPLRNVSNIVDQIIQAIYQIALEPEWEARSDFGSYGSRPGRNSHDAIEKIFTTIQTKNFTLPRKQWVLKVQVESCLNNKNSDCLMEKVKGFPGQLLLKRWLDAGYLSKKTFRFSTRSGQRNFITPILANILLNDLEKQLGITYRMRKSKHFPYFRYTLNDYIKKQQTKNGFGRRAFVRYNHHFVVLTENRLEALAVKQKLNQYLKPRGFKINSNFTHIAHLTEGFDFLGVNIRCYKCQIKKQKTLSTFSGYKPLIKPSKTAVKKAQNKIKQVFRAHQGKTVDSLIININPIIRGWCQYFRPFVSRKTMEKFDSYLFQRQLRFIYRTHPNKGKRWAVKKYFGQHCPLKPDDRWVFAAPKMAKNNQCFSSRYMLKHRWVPIVRHHMVPNGFCPDDPAIKEFWKQRRQTGQESNIVMLGDYKIAQTQRHTCPICGCSLYNNELLEKHHILPRKNGGKNQYKNLIFLHKICHQKVSINESYYENFFHNYLKQVKKERAIIPTKPIVKKIKKKTKNLVSF